MGRDVHPVTVLLELCAVCKETSPNNNSENTRAELEKY